MPHDWRSLLGELRVAWVDRGPNTSPGNVNIACPWCMNDPSHHLAISTTKDAYYCYRDNRHAGTDPVRLLVAMGETREEATRLLNRHLDRAHPSTPPTPIPDAIVAQGWGRFKPASGSASCVDYLASRGYAAPRTIAETFDLRYALDGEWAGRLLLPISIGGSIKGWTGRSISGSLEPKYRTQPAPGQPVLYTPDPDKVGSVAIVVEGPLDALRVSAASRAQPWISIAICGKNLNAAKLLEIRWLTSGCHTVLVALDRDVPISQVYATIAELSGALKAPVQRVPLPHGYDDPGEIANESVVPWIQEALRPR